MSATQGGARWFFKWFLVGAMLAVPTAFLGAWALEHLTFASF